MSGFRVKRVGYFGKMPKSGDFVSRNVDAAVREGFDRWLQESISESRAQMKEAWLDAFLTAPIWRFLLIGQFGASTAVLGIMIPSVDKVGRYFPLSILIELTDLELSQIGLINCDMVLHQFQDLLLSALSDDIDQDYFDYQIGLAARKLVDKPIGTPGSASESTFEAVDGLPDHLVKLRSYGGTIWWSDGSDSREAAVLTYQGMPDFPIYASFLRDPNHFRDLELAWDSARDLNSTQQDNPSVDLTDRTGDVRFHLISHMGTGHGQRNTSAATFSVDHQAIIISDGRFRTGHFAMASRVLGKVVPELLNQSNGDASSRQRQSDVELDRISSFFSTKFVGMPQPAISSPLSFACLFVSKPEEARLLIAGDYFCLHKGRHGIAPIFSTSHRGDDPTIRQDQAGHYKSVIITVEAGDRLLLCNASFDTPHLRSDVYDCFSVPEVEQMAKSLWQNATIKGVPGNLTLAAIEFSQVAGKISELQP